MPGYDAATKEITRRFAANGYAALMPNLTTGRARRQPGRCGSHGAGQGRVPDERLSAMPAALPAHLRGLEGSNGKGRRHRLLLRRRQFFPRCLQLQLDAAVDCYGAFIISPPPDGMPLKVQPIVGLAKDLSCPLLGLFGATISIPPGRDG